ncbi:hypothetical protein D3C84_916740 [compost metagenome]
MAGRRLATQGGHHFFADPAAQAAIFRVVEVHQQQLVHAAFVHQLLLAEGAVLQAQHFAAQLVRVELACEVGVRPEAGQLRQVAADQPGAVVDQQGAQRQAKAAEGGGREVISHGAPPGSGGGQGRGASV